MFLDNAGYHKASDVKQFVKECKGDIRLEYFLPYTPQLNKTENQWLNIQRSTANMLYEYLEARQSIRKGLRNGKIKITKMIYYLR